MTHYVHDRLMTQDCWKDVPWHIENTAPRFMTPYVNERLATQACNTKEGRNKGENSREVNEGRRTTKRKIGEKRNKLEETREK